MLLCTYHAYLRLSERAIRQAATRALVGIRVVPSLNQSRTGSISHPTPRPKHIPIRDGNGGPK